MAYALHRAAPAIVASALTVILGHALPRSSPTSTPRPDWARSPPSASVSGLLVMITLLPALLVIIGRWIFWPARPTMGTAEPTATGVWARVGTPHRGRPRTVWMTTVVHPRHLQPRHPRPQRDRPFDRGLVHQGVRLGEGPEGARPPTSSPTTAARSWWWPTRIRRPGQAGDVRAGGHRRSAARSSRTESRSSRLRSPTTPTSPAAFDTVDRVRASVHAVDGADALVGGGSAITADVEKASAHDNKVIIPLSCSSCSRS